MIPEPKPDSPEVLAKIYAIFRDYFSKSEKKRRWNLRTDIPWEQCHRQSNPAIADLVETFCAVELYLPDYLARLIPQARANRGRTWMLASWGYEESKHSLVLSDWLLKSGHRTEEQLAALDAEVFSHHWELPFESARGMICYTMAQELATWLHYQNLRKMVDDDGDPALHRILTLIAIDERAHFDFFKRVVAVYLDFDRPGTLEQIRQVMNTFQMPAIHMLTDSRRRINAVRELRIFDEEMFVQQVFEPILAELNVSRKELRHRLAPRETVAVGALPWQ